MDIIVGGILAIAAIVILGSVIEILREGIEYGDGFIIFVGVAIISIFVICIGKIAYDKVQIKNSTVAVENVTLEVISKSYSPSYTQVIPNGKTSTVMTHSEAWDVLFQDDQGHTLSLDDRIIFESLEIGDKIEGFRDIYTKKNGEVYKIILRIV